LSYIKFAKEGLLQIHKLFNGSFILLYGIGEGQYDSMVAWAGMMRRRITFPVSETVDMMISSTLNSLSVEVKYLVSSGLRRSMCLIIEDIRCGSLKS